MKIGIITLPTRTNYGGILQAFALSRVLKDLGHSPEVIYLPVVWNVRWYKYPLTIIKRVIKRYILNEKNIIFIERKLNREYPIVSKNTWNFIERYIPFRIVHKYESIKENEYDAFVVGSDQIWRPQYVTGPIENVYLAFAKDWNIKRVVYSASFGTDKWEYSKEQTCLCKQLLKQFNGVSCREKNGVEMCKEKFDCTAEHVLDPTLLLEKDIYSNFFDCNNSLHYDEILYYILDWTDNKRKLLDYIIKKTGCKSFAVNSNYEDPTARVEDRIQPRVEQWLQGFYDAKYVITDSFHACVFSIIFNKPFWVVLNENRGTSRISSLLSIFDLSNRIVSDIDSIKDVDSPINWDNVNAKWCKYKASSLDFIKRYLN